MHSVRFACSTITFELIQLLLSCLVFFPLLQRSQHTQAIVTVDTFGCAATSVFATMCTIGTLIVLVIGGLFIYKRFSVKQSFSDNNVHFGNLPSSMEAPLVKMSTLNRNVDLLREEQ